MADPILISDPQLDDSTFTSAVQPSVYTVQNTKFPINTEDSTVTLSAGDVQESFGFTILDLTGLGVTYEINDYIQITNESEMNGIYFIQAKTADSYTINLAYKDSFATATPSVQKYYNNYFNELRVFAIKEGDSNETQIGENSIKSIPVDVSGVNNATFNASGLIKSILKTDYNITRFYIEFKESYDEVVSGEVSQGGSSWITDDVTGCLVGQEVLTDPSFSTGLTNWDLSGANASYNAGNTSFDLTSTSGIRDDRSIQILQELNIPKAGTYNVVYNINNPSGSSLVCRLVWQVSYTSFSTSIVSISQTVTSSTSFNFDADLLLQPMVNYDGSDASIGLLVVDRNCQQGSCGNLVQIEDLSITSQDCTRKFFGQLGVNQFQDSNAFNLKDKVFGLQSTYLTGQFLTNESQRFKYFDNNELKLWYLINPFILNDDGNGKSSSTFEEVAYYDISGNQLETQQLPSDYTITGIDNIDFNGFISEFGIPDKAYYAIVNVYYVPDNLITANDNGTFDDCTTFDLTAIDGSLQSPICSGVPSSFSIIKPLESAYPELSTGVNEAVLSDESIFSIVGNVYIMECDIEDNSGIFQNDASICLIPYKDNGSGNIYDISNINIESSYKFEIGGGFKRIRTTFEALDSDFQFCLASFIPDGGTQPSAAVYNITNLYATGPRIDLSSGARVDIDQECRTQEIQLKWYNSEGGWEYWTFTAKKDHKYKVSKGTEIKKDVTLNFASGLSEYEYTSTNVRPQTVVRSQYLTQAEVEKLALIKESIDVRDITTGEVVVQVDRNSVTYRKETDKLFTIEFTVSYPNRQTVSI